MFHVIGPVLSYAKLYALLSSWAEFDIGASSSLEVSYSLITVSKDPWIVPHGISCLPSTEGTHLWVASFFSYCFVLESKFIYVVLAGLDLAVSARFATNS